MKNEQEKNKIPIQAKILAAKIKIVFLKKNQKIPPEIDLIINGKISKTHTI